MTGPTIARGSAADIDALEPLWVAVHHRHAESMPELAPYVSDADTWAERRALYATLLGKPDTVLLLAHLEGALIGYALSHVLDLADTWIPDTWRTGERIVELESLSVLPGHRGRGVGGALLDAIEREWDALGVDDAIVGVLAGNEHAARLYRRRGFRPTWLYLSRFSGRGS
jgi:ribosomal protein S18 acetylase RimI-like enzyme